MFAPHTFKNNNIWHINAVIVHCIIVYAFSGWCQYNSMLKKIVGTGAYMHVVHASVLFIGVTGVLLSISVFAWSFWPGAHWTTITREFLLITLHLIFLCGGCYDVRMVENKSFLTRKMNSSLNDTFISCKTALYAGRYRNSGPWQEVTLRT